MLRRGVFPGGRDSIAGNPLRDQLGVLIVNVNAALKAGPIPAQPLRAGVCGALLGQIGKNLLGPLAQRFILPRRQFFRDDQRAC